MSLEFEITYLADNNGTQSNETIRVILDELDGFSGECSKESEKLSIDFKKEWNMELVYTLESSSYYELNALTLKYVVDSETFPNAVNLGPITAKLMNQTLFSANKGNSYKCFSESDLTMNDQVKVEITNYQAQPFLDEKTKGFDTAIECSADTTGTSKLVPIIVGSALAILVVMVLVAYIIGRRKHRPGYQQV
jgi:lysosomal-associated membrane protein 1/2